jgi:hypothetical protein
MISVSFHIPYSIGIWKRAGVWEMRDGKPVALIDDYFTKDPTTGIVVDFLQDHYMPFVKKFANAVRGEDPAMFIFFEPVPNEYPPVVTPEHDDENYVYSPHWYDLKVWMDCLTTKKRRCLRKALMGE